MWLSPPSVLPVRVTDDICTRKDGCAQSGSYDTALGTGIGRIELMIGCDVVVFGPPPMDIIPSTALTMALTSVLDEFDWPRILHSLLRLEDLIHSHVGRRISPLSL